MAESGGFVFVAFFRVAGGFEATGGAVGGDDGLVKGKLAGYLLYADCRASSDHCQGLLLSTGGMGYAKY